jgi:leucyl aminopeptidase
MLIGFACIGCMTPPQEAESPPATVEMVVETGPRWITIDSDAIETARARGARHVGTTDGVAVMEIDAGELYALSQRMHTQHGRCGGFMLHDTLDDAHAALDVRHERAVVDYTLDNAVAVEALLPEVSEAEILLLIQQLSAMPSRYYTSSSGIAASTWLRDRWLDFASARPDVTVELFTHPEWPQKSVIATIPGTTLPDEVVVIGGHLDSISPGGGNAPGADDDASGIATLSEVLRVLMATDFRPHRTIKFMAYAAEEVGLRGSDEIATAFASDGIDVVGALQLDMTNYKGSTYDVYLLEDYTSDSQNAFLADLIDTYLEGVVRSTTACGYACSDHASWYRAGYRVSMPAESRMSDSNPEIHSPYDTLDVSDNNATHATKFARLATAYVAELAKGAPRPPATTGEDLEPVPADITAGDDGDGGDDEGGGTFGGCAASGGAAGLGMGVALLLGLRPRRRQSHRA